MTDAETPAAKPEPKTIAVLSLIPDLLAGKKIIAANTILDSRKSKLLQVGQEFISEHQLYALDLRGVKNAEVLDRNGSLHVEFYPPQEEPSKPHKFYQGVTDVKEPMKFLIKHAGGIAHADVLQKPVIDDLIDGSIAFLSQRHLAYKAHEKPFFDEYRNGDGKDGRQDYRAAYHEAVGTTLLAIARGNELPEISSREKMAFKADKGQIVLGTFMTPLALRMAPGHRAAKPSKYAGRSDEEVAGDLLWEKGFGDIVSLIARCSRKNYSLEELSKKHVRVRLPYEARNDYRQLYGRQ